MREEPPAGWLCDSTIGRLLGSISPADRDRAAGLGTVVGLGGLIATYVTPLIGVPVAVYGTAVVLYASLCPRRTILVNAEGMNVRLWPPDDQEAGWVIIPHVVITNRSSDPVSLDVWLAVPMAGYEEQLRVRASTVHEEAELPRGLECPISLGKGESASGRLCFSVQAAWVDLVEGQLEPGRGALEIRDRSSRSQELATVDLPTGAEAVVVDL